MRALFLPARLVRRPEDGRREGPQDAPPPYLPLFHSEESEAFHCNARAVLHLDRAIRRPLCDLDITPF